MTLTVIETRQPKAERREVHPFNQPLASDRLAALRHIFHAIARRMRELKQERKDEFAPELVVEFANAAKKVEIVFLTADRRELEAVLRLLCEPETAALFDLFSKKTNARDFREMEIEKVLKNNVLLCVSSEQIARFHVLFDENVGKSRFLVIMKMLEGMG